MRALISVAAFATLAFAIGVSLCQCTPAQSANDQKIAQEGILILNQVWSEAATLCAASKSTVCAKPLQDAYTAINVAALASDSWQAADTGAYACAAGRASAAIVEAFDGMGVAVPPLVADALGLVKLVGVCSADAGGAE